MLAYCVPFLGLVLCSICLFSVPKKLYFYSFFLFFLGSLFSSQTFPIFSLLLMNFVSLCFSVGLNFYQLHLLVVLHRDSRWPPPNNVPSFYFSFRHFIHPTPCFIPNPSTMVLNYPAIHVGKYFVGKVNSLVEIWKVDCATCYCFCANSLLQYIWIHVLSCHRLWCFFYCQMNFLIEILKWWGKTWVYLYTVVNKMCIFFCILMVLFWNLFIMQLIVF